MSHEKKLQDGKKKKEAKKSLKEKRQLKKSKHEEVKNAKKQRISLLTE